MIKNNTKKPKFGIGQLVLCKHGDKKRYVLVPGIVTDIFKKETTNNWYYNIWWNDRPIGYRYEIIQSDLAELVDLLKSSFED
jgi:hypothetical protein